jgi:secreted PhoX family phosphatase
MSDTGSHNAEKFDSFENKSVNPSKNPSFTEILSLSRRGFIGSAITIGGAVALSNMMNISKAFAEKSDKPSIPPLTTFTEIERGVDGYHHVAGGYNADILIRWGDPLFTNTPEFDPYNQTAEKQLKQFGYNNDYTGFIPLPLNSNNAEHGLLCVNHEYTLAKLMFEKPEGENKRYSKEQCAVMMASMGNTILEVKKHNGKWTYIKSSPFNRRISLLETEMEIKGTAAGDKRLKTKEDPTGKKVIGTMQNCAGGITPWGTYLTCEENINYSFIGIVNEKHPEYINQKRFGFNEKSEDYGLYFNRFNINKEPNEPNRFGWVVEIDPLNPLSKPVKHTNLGRFKHEGCTIHINKDGCVIAYMGDDQQNEYVYKFVSTKKYNSKNRDANFDIFESGILYVAQFKKDGKMEWLPLVYEQNGLDKTNGFNSQADVLIEARRAADILGATPMDRPEDVQTNPSNGKVYIALTNNESRENINIANTRLHNAHGQIIELTVPNNDHTTLEYNWNVLVMCGNPNKKEDEAIFHPETSENGWFSCPDNIEFDHQGRLWVTSDQGKAWFKNTACADGFYSVVTEGEKRGLSKMFFRVPVGAEMAGPTFTPDDKTLFLSVQHPSADATDLWKSFGRESTFSDPATRYPDFNAKMPPRPSVVVVTHKEGKIIGS